MQKTNYLKGLFFFTIFLFTFYKPALAQFDSLYRYRLEYQLGTDFNKVKTGYLVAFNSNTPKSMLTKIGTLSQCTHIGILYIDSKDSIWYIIHCTSNDYEFKENESPNAPIITHRLPVHPRDTTPEGVIITPLQDCIFSGEYYNFRIFPLKEGITMNEQKLLDFFETVKDVPFEKSKLQFTLAGIDIPFFNTDLFKNYREDKQLFCSEFLAYLLEYVGVINLDNKMASEYSPVEIVELPIFEQEGWEIQCPTKQELYKNGHYGIRVPEPKKNENKKTKHPLGLITNHTR